LKTCHSTAKAEKNLNQFLDDALVNITKKGQSCYHPKWVKTKTDFLQDQWKSILGSVPVLVYPFCRYYIAVTILIFLTF